MNEVEYWRERFAEAVGNDARESGINAAVEYYRAGGAALIASNPYDADPEGRCWRWLNWAECGLQVHGRPAPHSSAELKDGAEPDLINQPPHYTNHPSGVECIQITEHLSFCVGNAIKYLWRADEKGAPLDDLRKARWYIDREIARREREA